MKSNLFSSSRVSYIVATVLTLLFLANWWFFDKDKTVLEMLFVLGFVGLWIYSTFNDVKLSLLKKQITKDSEN